MYNVVDPVSCDLLCRSRETHHSVSAVSKVVRGAYGVAANAAPWRPRDSPTRPYTIGVMLVELTTPFRPRSEAVE